MPRKRKTVDIAAVIDHANNLFRTSKPEARQERLAVQIFVADLLHKTNNYRGFNYLRKGDLDPALPEATLPGIIFDESPARKHVYPDDSRIFFHR